MILNFRDNYTCSQIRVLVSMERLVRLFITCHYYFFKLTSNEAYYNIRKILFIFYVFVIFTFFCQFLLFLQTILSTKNMTLISQL